MRGWTPSLLIDTIADTPKFHAATEKVRQMDNHGAYSSAAGHAIYTARVYPKEWWNRTGFVCEPEAHLVGTFLLQPKGASFKSTNPFNLLASDDEWSAPIVAEVGPDGNVWVIDWYNFIVQHNPTPYGFKTGKGNAYESDLRDKKNGRIYRVVYQGKESSKPVAAPKLDRRDPASLLAALRHPTMLWRLEAQRLLVDRGELDVVESLLELVRDPSMDEIGLNVGAIHAINTLGGLGVVKEPNTTVFQAVKEALRHPSAGVRRAAVMNLPHCEASVVALAESKVTEDHDVQVRLASLLALADLPVSETGARLVASALRNLSTNDDRWIKDAIIARQRLKQFLCSLRRSSNRMEPRRQRKCRHPF